MAERQATGTALDPGEEDRRARKMVIPVWMARTLYVVAAVFALAALVVDVVGVSDWKVDEVSLGLIAVLLVIPLLEQIQKLKFGSMEAEFREKFRSLEDKVVDVREFATRPEADVAATRGLTNGASEAETDGVVRIKRIVWVDDRPENNRLEAQELKRRFDVTQVTSTEEGLAEVAKNPVDTAVISDSARDEGGRQNTAAGLELIGKLTEDQPDVPIYVYCGPATAAAYGDDLRRAGARLVTASFSELNARLRKDAGTSLSARAPA